MLYCTFRRVGLLPFYVFFLKVDWFLLFFNFGVGLSAWACSGWNLFVILIFEYFSKICPRKLQVLLKSVRNNRYFTWRPMRIYDHISLNSSESQKCWRQQL
jgi:hypothetical protein